MPSPFPGMDPWLEDRFVWPDFHDRLAEQISAALNQSLPQPYYAQLGVREELGIVGEVVTHRIVPDVSIQSSASPTQARQSSDSSGTAAVLDAPRAELTESMQVDLLIEPQSVSFVEIRDARSGHEVVTLIEILSPANKHPGPDHDSYLRKRNEVLTSTTSLIEIDLLRSGQRDFFGPDVHRCLYEFDPPLDYVVFIQRSWQRSGALRYQLFPARLTDSLPVIAVPLRESDRESSLDLQYAFQQTYDRGPYRRGAVDYSEPPRPPLPEDLQAWANEQIRRAASCD